MIPFFKKNRTLFSSLIAGLLVASFVFAPIAYSPQDKGGEEFKVQTAYADWADLSNQIIGNLSSIYNGIAEYATKAYTALSAASEEALKQKEITLDGIAWALINMIIQQMIKSVTRWVASGFAGSPAFVTDLKGFMMSIGDKVAGQYIAKYVPMLCTPFQLNIKIALMAQYQNSTRPTTKCTLTGSIANMRSFANGSFQTGGWAQWFNVALVPNNNPYSAAMNAQLDMEASIRGAQGQEMNLLKFGQGFFSKKKNGEVVNPGKVIETSLNNSLDLTNKRIAVADEINELIATLFSTLVSSILSSGDGLAGMGASGGASTVGSDAYWGALETQSNAMGLQGGGTAFTSDMQMVTENNSYRSSMASLITNASTYMSTTYPKCTSPNGTLTSSLQSQLTASQNKLTSNNAIITKIVDYKNDYATLSSGSGNTTLFAKYNATSATEAQGNLMNSYSSYTSSVGIPDGFISENAELQNTSTYTTRDNLVKEVTAFQKAIDTACSTSTSSTP